RRIVFAEHEHGNRTNTTIGARTRPARTALKCDRRERSQRPIQHSTGVAGKDAGLRMKTKAMSGCERDPLAGQLSCRTPAVWSVERRKAQPPGMRDRPGASAAGHVAKQQMRLPANRHDLCLARARVVATRR